MPSTFSIPTLDQAHPALDDNPRPTFNFMIKKIAYPIYYLFFISPLEVSGNCITPNFAKTVKWDFKRFIMGNRVGQVGYLQVVVAVSAVWRSLEGHVSTFYGHGDCTDEASFPPHGCVLRQCTDMLLYATRSSSERLCLLNPSPSYRMGSVPLSALLVVNVDRIPLFKCGRVGGYIPLGAYHVVLVRGLWNTSPVHPTRVAWPQWTVGVKKSRSGLPG